MPTRRQLLLTTAATGLAGAGALAGCSRESADPATDESDPLRLRVWSEAAAGAYETSLQTFTADTGIAVQVEVLQWQEYWETFPLDVAAESLPDVLWMNTAHLAQAQHSGALLEIGELLGDQVSRWDPVSTEQYRYEDGLWGIPQVYDQTLLVAHDDLVAAAGGDPSALTFDPAADTDALRDLARALTTDEGDLHPGDDGFDPSTRTVHGFSAHPDRTGILGPFIAAQGGAWQDEDGTFAFASDEGTAAVQYLADLAAGHLAPDGAETAADPSHCRDLFVEGKLGLLQTGTYDLATLTAAIDGSFTWSVHPAVAGPEGPHPLVHAVAAVGAATEDEERAEKVSRLLTWLGSVEGQRPLAEARLGTPAHRDLRAAWLESWQGAGVDLSALPASPETIARPGTGLRAAEGTGAALPIIAEVFTGDTGAAEALPEAQQAAQEAAA